MSSTKGNNDAKLFARGKTAELRNELVQTNKKDKNNSGKKIALKRIVANMTMSNNDMITLFSDVVACMAIPSLEIKKMCFLYLVNYSRQRPDIAITALPILLKDIEDNNPLIRALALRTMSYVSVDEYVKKTLPCIKRLIKDADPYVRKTAAFAVAKAYDHNRAWVEATSVIDSLNGMLQDDNPTVVSSALAALMDIWERNEAIKLTIDYANASKIIQILPDCSEWGQTYILEALANYVPRDTAEATILAERIAPRLSHSNSAVVLTSIRVILYFMNYIADGKVVSSLCQKLSPPLVTLLSKGPEIQYLALRNALLILQRRPEVLCQDIRVFFCKYNDPIYVKVAKLELIFLLANEKNIGEVLAELREYATEIDVDFVRKSVRVIGKLAIKIESMAKKCISTLLELVDTKVSYIVQEATVVIRNIFRKYPNQYESIISRLCENLDELDEPEAKAAMIWVIGQYADRIENVDELLEDFLFTFADETVEVQLALLTATVKLFLHRPGKGSELVPKVLKWATEETDNPDLRDRGYMYWRLLLRDHETAKAIVLGEKPAIRAESELVEAGTLEELCLVIGSFATIYLKPINHVFRTARVRAIGESEALQREQLPSVQAERERLRQLAVAGAASSSSSSSASHPPQPVLSSLVVPAGPNTNAYGPVGVGSLWSPVDGGGGMGGMPLYASMSPAGMGMMMPSSMPTPMGMAGTGGPSPLSGGSGSGSANATGPMGGLVWQMQAQSLSPTGGGEGTGNGSGGVWGGPMQSPQTPMSPPLLESSGSARLNGGGHPDLDDLLM